MKKLFYLFVSFLVVALLWWPTSAWTRGNAAGGSTSHSAGSTSHTSAAGTSTSHTAGEGTSHSNAWGGSTSHAYGEGTSHTNAYGGSASHAEGGGWSKTGAAGGTAYGDAHYGGAYHAPATAAYAGYHPPAVVNSYGASCYNCGGWAVAGAAATGAAVGMVAGASAASANTAAATSSAYSAGYAAGATKAAYVMGAVYPTVPAGCATPNVHGNTYYLCGNTWFKPSYGANGVYYIVVPAP
jgi:hypothetical protein